MLIFTKISELRPFLTQAKGSSKTLGFVPTMGALHKGHVSLIEISKKTCDLTLCSIFVNPTQFNDKKDLERYPRMPEKDIHLLQLAGCDVLFMPEVTEIYPNDEKKEYNFGNIGTTLEGEFRPGHFSGVAQVVQRFFEIIQPDTAFFGSKDYQQVMIIKALVKQMASPIKIVACPILREDDGLAMSSRNALLNAGERSVASLIPKIMEQAKQIVATSGISSAKQFIKDEISKEPIMRLDYFEVCEAETLKIVSTLTKTSSHIALIACFVGRIRLIDNIPLN